MTRKRFSFSPATAIALLALFFALGGGSAFAVGAATTSTTQLRTVATARSTHSFDEALNTAARKVPRALRGDRLTLTYQIRASNPHIAEYLAILSTG
jgi:hypothetical protein